MAQAWNIQAIFCNIGIPKHVSTRLGELRQLTLHINFYEHKSRTIVCFDKASFLSLIRPNISCLQSVINMRVIEHKLIIPYLMQMEHHSHSFF